MLSRGTTWAVGGVMLSIARKLPERGREYFLGYASPLMLFLTAVLWLIGIVAGFALFGWGVSRMPLNEHALGNIYSLRRADIGLSAAAWLSTFLLLVAFTVHLVSVTSAYSRRERLISRLTAQATRTPDAEAVFAEYTRGGCRDHLGALFSEWADWLADIQATHLAYPALVHYRSGGSFCWTNAAQIMLDCAALAEACVPNWAPPETRSLLNVGERCLPRIAARLGIDLPPVPVSYQGRETYPFSRSLAEIRTAGLSIEVDDEDAQLAFQRLRVRYAPFANAICERLLYEYMETLDGNRTDTGDDTVIR